MTKKHQRLLLGAILLCLVIAALCLIFLVRPAKETSFSDELLSASEGMNSVYAEIRLDTEHRRIVVHQDMLLSNHSGVALEGIVLRAPANAYASLYTSPYATDELFSQTYPEGFSTGSLSIQSLTVNGVTASHSYADEAKTICFISYPWPAGEELSLSVDYVVEIPQTACRFGVLNDVYSLGDALLYPASVQEDGVSQPELYSWGELPEQECANYTVELSYPSGYECVGSGLAESSETDDSLEKRTRFTGRAVRSFGLCVFPSRNHCSGRAGSVIIHCYASNGDRAGKLLRAAQNALSCYEKHFGAYPYPVLNVAESSLFGSGAAYTSLILVPESAMEDDTALEESVSLLAARQWWSQAVSPNRYETPWMTESLCVYSHLLYLQDVHGYDARQAYEQQHIFPASRITISGDATPGAPMDHFSTNAEFQQMTGERGCALLIALELFSDGKLDEALTAYFQTYRFRIVSRKDFTELISGSLGKDIAPLMLDYLDTIN